MQHIFVEKEMNASMNDLWLCNGMAETGSCLIQSSFSPSSSLLGLGMCPVKIYLSVPLKIRCDQLTKFSP